MAEASRQPDEGMEDLLASIRRIISQESPATRGASGAFAEDAAPAEADLDDVAERLARTNLDADLLPDLVEEGIREAFAAGLEEERAVREGERSLSRGPRASDRVATAFGEPDLAQSRRVSPIEGRKSWPEEPAARVVRSLRQENDRSGPSGWARRQAVPPDERPAGRGGDRPAGFAQADTLTERAKAGAVDMDESFVRPDPEIPAEERGEERNVFRRPGEAGRGSGRPDDGILSDRAEATVGQAFENLSRTILSSNPRTLEDLVRDLLRPMLREWMDRNLPEIVERMVRQEIDRVTSRGR